MEGGVTGTPPLTVLEKAPFRLWKTKARNKKSAMMINRSMAALGDTAE
jgi:hypothetical protein